MISWVKDENHLKQAQDKNKDLLLLGFYGGFSQAAKRALSELEQFSRENEKVPVYIVDVEKVKGVHKQFGVKNVPTVLALKEGKVTRSIEGVESARFYANFFLGKQYSQRRADGKEISHRIVVYTGPGCPACGAAKSYLRRMGINFREIDVAANQSEAKKLVRRSGQMAVPQIDIDGHLIVGFDKTKIDALLLGK